jgi:hypothetical protein
MRKARNDLSKAEASSHSICTEGDGGVFGQSGHFQARAKRPKMDINSLSAAALTIVDEYEFVCDTRKVRRQRDAHAGSKAHKIKPLETLRI